MEGEYTALHSESEYNAEYRPRVEYESFYKSGEILVPH